MCFSQPWVRPAKATGDNPVYYVSDKPGLVDTPSA